MTPETLIKGSTPDISRLVEHEWYDWVKFRDVVPSFPNTNEALGRWLRPLTNIGSEMCCHILKQNRKVVQRTTVCALTDQEIESESEKTIYAAFDAEIEAKLGPKAKLSDFIDNRDSNTPHYKAYWDASNGTEQRMARSRRLQRRQIRQIPWSRNPILSSGDSILRAVVKTRGERDANGNPIGKANANPLLDTRLYKVEFPDGDIHEYAATSLPRGYNLKCIGTPAKGG